MISSVPEFFVAAQTKEVAIGHLEQSNRGCLVTENMVLKSADRDDHVLSTLVCTCLVTCSCWLHHDGCHTNDPTFDQTRVADGKVEESIVNGKQVDSIYQYGRHSLEEICTGDVSRQIEHGKVMRQ